MSIELREVEKSFGTFAALRRVSLQVPDGELVALLGPSGSGKTTLLRVIAGLETPDGGQVLFDGEDVTDRHVRHRRVGFVFQHYALFRHLSVFENVAFGLRVRPREQRPPEAELRERVRSLLRLVQLEALAERRPAQLSGGQRQRVALARALAVEPRVLLLDEPFGALDARVRQELRRWLRRLHDELHVTSVFVTHDQEEALEVADRVVVMNEGRVEQVGTPEDVYDRPASPFVYDFLGAVNLFRGRVGGGRLRIGPVGRELELGTGLGMALETDPESAAAVGAPDGPAVAYFRPHDVEVHRRWEAQAVEAVVRQIRQVGPVVRLVLGRRDGGEPIEAQLSRERGGELALRVGELVYVRPRSLRVFVAPTGGGTDGGNEQDIQDGRDVQDGRGA